MKKPDKHQRDLQKRRAIRARRKAHRKRRRRKEPVRRLGILTLTLSGNLDLIGDDGSTRVQLNAFERVRIPPKRSPDLRLFVDVSKVETIDPCALLHVVAQIDRLTASGKIRVSGNYPTSEAALQMFADAGFHKYMGSKVDSLELRARRSKIPPFEISSGAAAARLNPQSWAKLHEFLKDTGNLDDDQTDAVYQAFGECIENVLQHAFLRRSSGGSWYALAIGPQDNVAARVVVLDVGLGIAATVRRPKHERIVSAVMRALVAAARPALRLAGIEDDPDEDEEMFLNRMTQALRSSDWFCVYMATRGLRTRSARGERGTGLVGLRDAMLNVRSGALHVLSGRAAVNWRQGFAEPQRKDLPTLRGTIVCLELGEHVGPQSPTGS